MVGRVACAAVGALVVLSSSRDAGAQEFDSELLRAGSPGDSAFFGVQTATPPPARTLSFGVRAGFAQDPLVAFNSDNDERVGGVINKRAFTEVAAALSFGKAELWVALPFILYQRSDVMPEVVLPLRADKSGIGDLRVGARYRFFGSSDGLALAVAADLALPTHARAELSGDDGLGVSPRVIAEYASPTVTLGFNVGLRIRPRERLGDLRVGSAFVYGVGAAYALPLPLDPSAVVELAGEVGAGEAQEAPVEVRAGFRFHSDSASLAFGYGHGLAPGYGAPAHRAFVMASYAFGSSAPETERRIGSNQDPDPDKDTIIGTDDDCPNEAEDKDGYLDLDGCPDTDNDNDGVFDNKDTCPDIAEDKDGFQDTDGCVDLDNDGDGINDEVDDCPSKPEVINGTADDDGCPDNGKQEVHLETGRFRFDEQITFARRGSSLSPKGQNLAGQVARLLVRNPDILRIRIESHTDEPGSDSANLLLSQRRAESVRDALVVLGVAEDRIEVFGHGRKKPVASSRTAAGRARNERIDILIIERKEPGKAQGGRP